MKDRKKYTEADLPAEPVCFTCPYFGQSDSGEHTCRRHAPIPRMTFEKDEGGGDPLTNFPAVCPIEVCGEHPLFPDYIRRIAAVGALKLGKMLEFGSDAAPLYQEWREELLVKGMRDE
jgi:hypothetical protein